MRSNELSDALSLCLTQSENRVVNVHFPFWRRVIEREVNARNAKGIEAKLSGGERYASLAMLDRSYRGQGRLAVPSAGG